MFFAVDVDQTIAGENAIRVYAEYFNREFSLGIADEALASLASYEGFLSLPELVALRERGEYEEMWRKVRRRAIADRQVVRQLTPIAGAVEGVSALARVGTVRYYSARPREVLEETRDWLERYRFPNFAEVVCCDNVDQKICALAAHEPEDEPMLLIDDRAHTSILAALRCVEPETFLLLVQRLRLLAFGVRADALPETFFALAALPSWGQLDEVGEFLTLG